MAKLLLGKEVTAALNAKLQEKVAALKEKGASIALYDQVGGAHCEADWEKQNPIFMNYLWKD